MRRYLQSENDPLDHGIGIPYAVCIRGRSGKGIQDLKDKGITTYAAHLEGKHSYDEENLTNPCAFLIGNEGNGLRREIADMADCYIKIPMLGQVESLNAAIASSVLMFEAARQRRKAD